MNSEPISEPRIKPDPNRAPESSIPNPNVPTRPPGTGRGQRPPQKPGKGMPLPGRI